MSLPELFKPKEHPNTHWVKMNQIPNIDYWFGCQFPGALSNKLMLNTGLIREICRQTYLPPLVLTSLSGKQNTSSSSSLATLEPLDELWKEVPVGWFIRINSNRLTEKPNRNGKTALTTEELAAKRLDQILKVSLLKVGAYEALNLRLKTLDQLTGMTGRGLRQIAAVLGAAIAAGGIEDLRMQIPLALMGFAVIQNFLGIRRDISGPAFYSDVEMEAEGNMRDIVEQWRRDRFGDRYYHERLGPGMLTNALVHSVPFSEVGEPLVRYGFAIREVKEKLVKVDRIN